MKLPFDFSLKFAFRLLLPGFVLSLGLFPIVQTILLYLRVTFPEEYAFSLSVIVSGYIFVILDMPIYMAFEGRRYWPRSVWRFLVHLEQRRLERLKKQIAKFEISDRAKYLEASVELRRFPMGEDGEYHVQYPTRLGNLLAAYEIYPERTYGMDPVFYWHRIWLTLDKELREEIDHQQALADSTIYTVTALIICSLLCLIYAFLQMGNIQWVQLLPDTQLLFGLAVFAVVGSYVLYRSSLHIHANFGETFKSVFDIYRENISIKDIIDQVSKVAEDASLANRPKKEQYKIVWRYLHNYRIKIDNKICTPADVQAEKQKAQGKRSQHN